MIPRHRPPFGIGRVLLSVLDRGHQVGVEEVEQAYEDTFGVPYAILLPSARAGISWALRATLVSHARVLCPGFTCAVVHEAVVFSKAQLHVLDIAPAGFLMDPADIRSAAQSPYAIVLSEMYGHAYDLAALSATLPVPPALRVVDMALGIPVQAQMDRLVGNDFAVISFGLGKSLYAGWGGIGLTRDRALADEVRRIRDFCLSRESTMLAIRRACRIFLLTAAYNPAVYGLLREFKRDASTESDVVAVPAPLPVPTNYLDQCRATIPRSAEWHMPSSGPDRYLTMHNLKQSKGHAARRLELAAFYHKSLEGVAGIVRPPVSPFPLNPYTIRVRAEVRPAVLQHLLEGGIRATTHFRFSPFLDASKLVHTWRTTAEVVNLPLFESLRRSDVERVVRQLKCCTALASG